LIQSRISTASSHSTIKTYNDFETLSNYLANKNDTKSNFSPSTPSHTNTSSNQDEDDTLSTFSLSDSPPQQLSKTNSNTDFKKLSDSPARDLDNYSTTTKSFVSTNDNNNFSMTNDLSSSSSDEEDRESSEYDENDEDDRIEGETGSLREILPKYGLDYKSLLTVCTVDENGQFTDVKPSLNSSLFHNVPPTINFVTHNEKSKRLSIEKINFKTKYPKFQLF
jgi:hypothetical protein